MSYIHKPLLKPLEGRTPFQLLRDYAATHPNKEAFVFRDVEKHRVPITFQEYETRSQSLAAGFLELGLKRGDRVLLMVGSCPEFVYIHLALNRIGAVVVVSHEENCRRDLKDIKNLACVIAKSDFRIPVGQQMLQEIQARLNELQSARAVLIGCEADLIQHKRVFMYNDLFDLAKKNPDSQARLEQAEKQVLMDDPFMIMFTSGSTGSPKPIEFSNHAYVNDTFTNGLAIDVTQDTRLFNDCPFDWTPGISWGIGTVISRGCTLILFPPKVGFNGGFTSIILEIIAEERCTIHSLVLPFFLNDMVLQDVPGVDLSTMKSWVTGGQPLSIPLLKKVLNIMSAEANIVISYGSTETNSMAWQVVNRNNVDEIEDGLMDIINGFEMKIIDKDGLLVPIGEKGELCVRAPWVAFPNYDILLSSQNITKPQANNWHRLGDFCSLNKKGQLKLFGRMDDLIKCACESIQPNEVEQVLYKHQDVDKVCVCGVPDQRLYNKICACIVLKAGKKGDQAVFEEWSEENFVETSMGLTRKPHYYLFLDSLPLTRTGKLCRRQTKELAIKKLGLA